MATLSGPVEIVRAELKGRTTSRSTVTAVQNLLELGPPKAASESKSVQAAKSISKSTKTVLGKTGRPAARKTNDAHNITIHEDASGKKLSPREKCALATEIVNNSLKILSETQKSNANGPAQTTSPKKASADSTPKASIERHLTSQQALKARSGNTTPVGPSAEKQRSFARLSSSSSIAESCRTDSSMAATAECAHLAFSLLRSVDPSTFGGREMPPLQLESGMLALAGKMIAHGLDSMALEELRIVKRRLESSFQTQKSKSTKNPATMSLPRSDKETLASLMFLDVDLHTNGEAMAVAITYYLHVLRIIAISREAVVIEEVLQYLQISKPNSFVDLTLRHTEHGGDNVKCAKQLESLSQTILALCPSVSTSSNAVASNPEAYPSPETVLELQVLAFRIRKLWWRMSKYKADVSKELVEPLLKCATAYVRRTSSTKDGAATYVTLERCIESVELFEFPTAGGSVFNIYYLLHSQAEAADMDSQSQKWADAMECRCASLEHKHVKRVICAVNRLNSTLRSTSSSEELSCIDTVSSLLCSKLTGNRSDYDLLLTSLAKFCRTLDSRKRNSATCPLIRLSGIIAGFGLRYWQSYPGKNTAHVQAILDTALRLSGSIDDMLLWVTEDAAKFLIQEGAIENVAVAAATKSCSIAWAGSASSISLSHVLRVLVLRAMRNSGTVSTLVFDIENLEPAERGMLLEMQLKYAVGLASKPKYFDALHKMLSDLLDRLSKIYTAVEYPIRRARVAGVVLRACQGNTGLLSPRYLRDWQDTNLQGGTNLGRDVGLLAFLEDVRNGLGVAQAFLNGRPSVNDLKPSLEGSERIVDRLQNGDDLHRSIEDPHVLMQQLSSIIAYFDMLGEDNACLAPQMVLLKLTQFIGDHHSQVCSSSTDLARLYLQLGYSERAGTILSQIRPTLEQYCPSPSVALDFNVAYAEYLLAIDKLDECRLALDEARISLSSLSAQATSRDARRACEVLHAQGLFVESRYLQETGSPHKSLASAKRSVRILNSIWSSLERSYSTNKSNVVPDIGDVSGQDTKERTGGVSKLQLTPNDSDRPTEAREQGTNGAAFWALVSPLCKSLLQLSDVYAHHGLFNESSYYSERAIHIAESVGSSELLLRLRCHRSRLLVLGNRSEEAELCLAQHNAHQNSEPSQTLIQYYCSQAAIREQEGSLDEASSLHHKAEDVLESLASDDFIRRLERIDGHNYDIESRMTSLSLSSAEKATLDSRTANAGQGQPGKLKAPVKKNVTRTNKITANAKSVQQEELCPTHSEKNDYLIQKIKADIVLQRAFVELRRGRSVQSLLDGMQNWSPSPLATLRQRLLAHRELIQGALASLQMDVALNVLPESTLSFPAIEDGQYPTDNSSSAVKNAVGKKKSSAKAPKKKEIIEAQFLELLYVARESLVRGQWRSIQLCGTIQTHAESTQLLKATLLLSTVPGNGGNNPVQPLDDMLLIDLPRNKALEYERQAMTIDEVSSDASELSSWASPSSEPKDANAITAAEFQEMFVDILPLPWTAVSMCLSEDESELYIARYRSGQTPLILRLPFSRHKSDGLDEDAFDYFTGKTEIQEIIELSNHTCHHPGVLNVKGAKTKWWTEREALDRRMQELLINVENIWLGGFKGILSRHRASTDLLASFRGSFEAILDRYLPSRQAVKDRRNDKSVHDHVLELFIGLGDDQDGVVDLDEPLADLLYFVVETLQFNGERNAYDEIDFDSMAVDVLEALRVYHSAYNDTAEGAQHLILVLDRRLQAFPWESLPCLEQANVSRVGSLLSLRKKIIATRSAQNGSPADDGSSGHTVRRTGGTYILNPSSDLKGTQAMLGPVLSTLHTKEGGSWNSIVNSGPDEASFGSALKDSSMLLYFGHGAGCQYIRPRTIKRLEQCCNVVWLMGCSSGIVQEYGKFEPCAVPLTYLLAGEGPETISSVVTATCKAVVATLWDVTDKDIDRFSLALGEEWGLWPAQEQPQLPSKTPKKREIHASAPSTPQQMPKTPKTPKVVKTPATFKTPIRNRPRVTKSTGGKQSLVEAVNRSRSACYLRYLNGAAPVVYGIPVYLSD